jgi:hypothetical protein
MDYVIDLDPTHLVLRLTAGKVSVTDLLVIEAYRTLARLAAQDGPYALIVDGSKVGDVRISPDTIRFLAAEAPAVPGCRPRIFVSAKPVGYGLARMFTLLRDDMRKVRHVAWSLDEAYAMLGVAPEDFSQRLFPEVLAA